MNQLPPSVVRIQEILVAMGLNMKIEMLPGSTATARDAANALGVRVNQIGKTIVFDGHSQLIAVVLCGDERVDLGLLETRVGKPISSMKAKKIKKLTDMPIGGVSPFGLPKGSRLLVDKNLAALDVCYVAAGHPHAVLKIHPHDLVTYAGGELVSVT